MKLSPRWAILLSSSLPWLTLRCSVPHLKKCWSRRTARLQQGARRQRNTKEENKQIKAGNGKDLWNAEEGESEKEKKRKMHKKSHKDVDARWTKKRGENHYGYKNHIKADKKTKLIEKYHTTNASVHDSNVIKPLIEEKDKGQDLFLDAGYESKEDIVKECGMNPVICEKGHRNNPLTDEQKQNNRIKSKDRCRIV